MPDSCLRSIQAKAVHRRKECKQRDDFLQKTLPPGFRPQLAFVHIAISVAVAAVYAHIVPVALALGGVFGHGGAVGDALLYFGTAVGIQAQVGRAVGAVHGINMAQANLALV